MNRIAFLPNQADRYKTNNCFCLVTTNTVPVWQRNWRSEMVLVSPHRTRCARRVCQIPPSSFSVTRRHQICGANTQTDQMSEPRNQFSEVRVCHREGDSLIVERDVFLWHVAKRRWRFFKMTMIFNDLCARRRLKSDLGIHRLNPASAPHTTVKRTQWSESGMSSRNGAFPNTLHLPEVLDRVLSWFLCEQYKHMLPIEMAHWCLSPYLSAVICARLNLVLYIGTALVKGPVRFKKRQDLQLQTHLIEFHAGSGGKFWHSSIRQICLTHGPHKAVNFFMVRWSAPKNSARLNQYFLCRMAYLLIFKTA